jgi:hypothetical protein
MKNFVQFVVKSTNLVEPCSNREEARALKRELKAAGHKAEIERREYSFVNKKIIR